MNAELITLELPNDTISLDADFSPISLQLPDTLITLAFSEGETV